FVNPALTEPFGLTLLEAAASGLPLVATENGGPVDIIGNCKNGLLVDPLSREAIADALLSILQNPSLWQKFSSNGLRNIARFYSWEAHAQSYLDLLKTLVSKRQTVAPIASTHQFRTYRKRALFTAIDNTLLGDNEGLEEFKKVVRTNRRQFLFGIATGRRLDSVLTILKRHCIAAPDVLITSLGTEIYYTAELIPDVAWSLHIDHSWTPLVLRRVLESLPGLSPQRKSEQSRFKVSYFYDVQLAPPIEEILGVLRQQDLSVNATLSFGQYLDLVPARASKGQALRYVTSRYNIPLDHTLVTGGSGGDADMLRGNTLGVVVANRHQEELSDLTANEQVFFASRAHAWGILEAISHYNFF
ncbi:MAG: HAD-IIB family hydrolase, partial [bacterium]